jgi:hypothetical protein
MGPFAFMLGAFFLVPVAAVLLPTAGSAAAGAASAAARLRRLAASGTAAQQPGQAVYCGGHVERFLTAAATVATLNLACGAAGTAALGAIALCVGLLGKNAARFLGAPSMHGAAVAVAAAGVALAAVAWRSSGALADPAALEGARAGAESDSAALVARPAEVLAGHVMSP